MVEDKWLDSIPNPCYVMEEKLLRRNLSLIRSIMDRAEVEFILAFKAFALWKTFPVFREYIGHTTASSLYEARLAFEEFGSRAHVYSPAYQEGEFDEILKCASHVTFNSFSQYSRFIQTVSNYNKVSDEKISCGIRINPEHSEIETELYNPCAPGSRFGVLQSQMPDVLPEGIDGLHCHCHCENDSYALEATLKVIDEKFGKWLTKVNWLNLGGGHLVTRADYDVEHLISILKAFKQKYPNLRIILEPGSAFAWQTGPLVAKVVDIVENYGIQTAILNVSFTCHMPDCLEMPYQPAVRCAETLDADACKQPGAVARHIYRLGGNSCLSGDYMGSWQFDHELQIGEKIIFEDMIHYTTVKTNMFNGIHHPSIAFLRENGDISVLRNYKYEDYRDRMC